jgi:hypothetical protein
MPQYSKDSRCPFLQGRFAQLFAGARGSIFVIKALRFFRSRYAKPDIPLICKGGAGSC